MRESQYQIPRTGVLHEGGSAATVQIESNEAHEGAEFTYTPEIHQQVKAIENRIDWYRYEALHAPMPAKTSLGVRILTVLGLRGEGK